MPTCGWASSAIDHVGFVFAYSTQALNCLQPKRFAPLGLEDRVNSVRWATIRARSDWWRGGRTGRSALYFLHRIEFRESRLNLIL